MFAGVVSYTLLYWGGFAGLVSLTSSPYSSDFLFSAGFGLPPEFCYVCVGLAHLVYYGILYKTLLARKLSEPEDGHYMYLQTLQTVVSYSVKILNCPTN